jgi:hypothetical protein
MKTLLALFIFIILLSGCGQSNHPEEHPKTEMNPITNEDKFGFLVFDTKQIDSFFKTYSPLNSENETLRAAFAYLVSDGINVKDTLSKFSQHTTNPNSSDQELAVDILTYKDEKEPGQYFDPSLHYLFFYKCLPREFTYKWPQTISGDFSFNVTFFKLLRNKCKSFDEHIYREVYYWDKKMSQALFEEITNEITTKKAQEIKNCILSQNVFEDETLKTDKDNFIEMLNNTITGKWRLFLLDHN